jgi:hypothetical protein
VGRSSSYSRKNAIASEFAMSGERLLLGECCFAVLEAAELVTRKDNASTQSLRKTKHAAYGQRTNGIAGEGLVRGNLRML